jgi:hypothetical protein
MLSSKPFTDRTQRTSQTENDVINRSGVADFVRVVYTQSGRYYHRLDVSGAFPVRFMQIGSGNARWIASGHVARQKLCGIDNLELSRSKFCLTCTIFEFTW